LAEPLAIVADDDDGGRLLLAEAAAAAGFQTLAFDNGQDALAAALSAEVSLLLLDVEMPGLDGFELCRRVRAAKRASLPIVMVTSLNDPTAIDTAFQAGATDFITKPVNWNLLPHRLAYILRNADREAKMSMLVDAMPDALWVVSPDGTVRWAKEQPSLTGNPPPTVGLPPASLTAGAAPVSLPDVLAAVRATAADGRARELEFRESGDGPAAVHSAQWRFTRVDGGNVLVVRQDTSERTSAALHIERLAYYDSLTGLPNRQQCLELIARLLADTEGFGGGVALLYVALNGLNRINDTFGHSVGDVVLKRIAQHLARDLQDLQAETNRVLLGRLGGAEFVVVVQGPGPRELALAAADVVCKCLLAPVSYEQVEFLATPSIGIAVYPDDGADVESLLKHADTAMYQAKQSGGPPVLAYAPAMSARLRDSLELESNLRRALRDNRLSLRFQPKFRLTDQALVGAEALLRWFDSELGEISPGRFIPIAEESGLILEIGGWVMHAVCNQLRAWRSQGLSVPIAVNVSGKEILFADPSRMVKAETDRAGIPASLIEVEITESVFVTDLTTARSSIERIRRLGSRIALDDFGTGYSSLSYLRQFPPDRLKIDRSFVAQLERSESDAEIVKAILSLAKTLRLSVTAEGVETQGQLQWLMRAGCDEAQGYLLGKPLSAADFEARFLLPERRAEPDVPAERRA
jgi:diguanylate cyclase (GGDEF)-like protein